MVSAHPHHPLGFAFSALGIEFGPTLWNSDVSTLMKTTVEKPVKFREYDKTMLRFE
jgi:hypothetical protein